MEGELMIWNKVIKGLGLWKGRFMILQDNTLSIFDKKGGILKKKYIV